MIYGVRPGTCADGSPTRDYWITDGLYGSMNSILYDHARPLPGHCICPAIASARPLHLAHNESFRQLPVEGLAQALIPSTVFGPTCDGLDTVLREFPLPELTCEDWLVFPSMGAYTTAGASAFNGFDNTSPTVFYVFSEC